MKLSRNKTITISIAILLIASMSTSMLLVPNAGAHTPAWSLPTFAYINASPNPVGVGQYVEVIMWLNYVIDGAAANNAVRFQNYKLTITDPTGTVTTQSYPVVQDTTSAQDYFFTPDKVGTYTLKFDFPGQTYSYATTSAYKNDTYLASSASTTLTVLQEPISHLTLNPLPTNYWTRPIYGTNPNWNVISSNWLGTGSVGYTALGFGGPGEIMNGNNGDSVGSMTGHIMWTKPLQAGGIVGGNQSVIQGASYFEGSAYSQRYVNPIIMEGLLYYTEPVGYNGPSAGPTVCVNLQTGQVVWRRTDVPALSFGYIYDQQNPNQHGTWPPMLFASSGFGSVTWRVFDAYTGNPIVNVTNIPSGTKFLGPNGEQLIIRRVNYGTTAAPNYYIQEWNSSKLWFNANNFGTLFTANNAPSITDGSNALMFDWNVSAPYLNTVVGTVTQVGGIANDVLLCYNGSLPSTGATFLGTTSSQPYTYFTLSLNPSSLGQAIWHQTLNPPPNNISVLEDGIDPVNRVFVENYRETNNFVGYSLDTGSKLWGPTASQPSLDYYGSPGAGTLAAGFAYGKLYSSAYAGVVFCYDTKTGNLLWTYGNGGSGNTTDSGLETPFGHYPTFISAIGSGVVYTVTTEHTIETPLFKGSLARAINATTGEEIWTVSSYTGEFTTTSYAMADGYNTWFNGYDNSIYVVGRGPSATTVQAPLTSVNVGDTVVLQGTVMDKSTGTTQTQTGR